MATRQFILLVKEERMWDANFEGLEGRRPSGPVSGRGASREAGEAIT